MSRLDRSPRRLLGPLVLTLLSALTLTACGSSGHAVSTQARSGGASPSTAGPSAPSAADPITAHSTIWPFLGGPSHDGAGESVGPRTDSLAWRDRLGAPIVPGPVITGDTALVGTDDGTLRAVDVATGAVRWSFDAGAPFGVDLSTGPLILSGGEILWPGPRDRLYALTPSGHLLWSVRADGEITTPVLVGDDLLVLADESGHISGYRLDAAAPAVAPQRLWSTRLATESYGSPAVAANGTIYQTAGNCLYAVSDTGRVMWTVGTGSEVEVSAAIATNGIVVFGSNDRLEWGVDPDGKVRWREAIGNYTYSSPLALAGRQVIFGNHSGQMTLLDSDTGRVIHRYDGSGEIWTAAAVDRDGDVYFATRTGHIYGFSRAGRPLFDDAAGGKFDSYPAIADGRLIIGDDSGNLVALG